MLIDIFPGRKICALISFLVETSTDTDIFMSLILSLVETRCDVGILWQETYFYLVLYSQ